MTKRIAQIITFLGGLYFFLEFLLPEVVDVNGTSFKFNTYHQDISIGIALISSMAIGLGVINILLVHGLKIFRSKKNILPSAVLIISFFVTLIFLSLTWIKDERIQSSWKDLQSINDYIRLNNEEDKSIVLEKIKTNLELINAGSVPEGIGQQEYLGILSAINVITVSDLDVSKKIEKISETISEEKKQAVIKANEERKETIVWRVDHLIFYGLFFPLGSSMFSLLGFYITYAAFRSFRVKSKESTVMMLAALVVILGQIPQGVMYISEDIPGIRLWIMQYVSTPAFRAIYFCSALAGLSLAVRMWFSLDKNPFLSK